MDSVQQSVPRFGDVALAVALISLRNNCLDRVFDGATAVVVTCGCLEVADMRSRDVSSILVLLQPNPTAAMMWHLTMFDQHCIDHGLDGN